MKRYLVESSNRKLPSINLIDVSKRHDRKNETVKPPPVAYYCSAFIIINYQNKIIVP